MRFPHLPIFATDETHGRALRASNRLIVHSPAMGWRSLYGAIIEESPFEATEPAMGHPALIYHLARPTQVTRRVEGARPDRAVVGPAAFVSPQVRRLPFGSIRDVPRSCKYTCGSL